MPGVREQHTPIRRLTLAQLRRWPACARRGHPPYWRPIVLRCVAPDGTYALGDEINAWEGVCDCGARRFSTF